MDAHATRKIKSNAKVKIVPIRGYVLIKEKRKLLKQ